MNEAIKKNIITSLLVSIAIVINIISKHVVILNLSMPFGGSFFSLEYIPLVLIGFFFGFKHGLIGSLIFAVFNFGSDYFIYLDCLKQTLESFTGTSWRPVDYLYLILFDYIIPFGAYSISGFFKDSYDKNKKSILAFLIIFIIKVFSSSISGIIIWSNSIIWASEEVIINPDTANIATKLFSFVGNNMFLYSFFYNFSYNFTSVILSLSIFLLIKKRLKVISETFISNNTHLQFSNSPNEGDKKN